MPSSSTLASVGTLLEQPTAETSASSRTVVAAISLNMLEPPEHSLREDPDDPQIASLAESMHAVGLLHPIGATLLPSGRFRVIFGQRRLAAAKRLGWQSITCSLRVEVDEADALVAAVAENVVRRDLTPSERASALRALGSLYVRGRQVGGGSSGTFQGILPAPRQPNSAGGLARRLGVNPTTIQRLVPVSQDETLLRSIADGAVSLTSASYLARLPEGPMRSEMLERVQAEHLGSSRVLREVRRVLHEQREPTASSDIPTAASVPSSLHKLRLARGMLAAVQEVVSNDEVRELLESIEAHVARLRQVVATNAEAATLAVLS